ncbi:MAG: YitT family protein [Oscillospiraceae bacterium]|nr:YitT family protein [Oscillospiraceae bacterium]
MGKLKSWQKSPALRQIKKYVLIVLGCAIYGFGFQFFCFPNQIISGGVMGIAMIVNAVSGLPVGVLTILMNVPLFLVAWKHFGLDFLIGSLVGMLLMSVFVDLLAISGYAATQDPMLGAVIGGVLKGAGMGLVFCTGATTGGMDIVVKFLRRRYNHINFGTLMLVIDVSVITLYALILPEHNYEAAMYSLIAMFVSTKVIDLLLYGLDNSSICYIISAKSEALIAEITSGHMHRGVTVLEGEGAYSHAKKQVIMCVVKRNQIPEIRRLVRSIDDQAFVIMTDAKNVFGNGFGNIAEVR